MMHARPDDCFMDIGKTKQKLYIAHAWRLLSTIEIMQMCVCVCVNILRDIQSIYTASEYL